MQTVPMKPGIGYVADSAVDLERKLVWNTWFIGNLLSGGGGSVIPTWVTVPASSSAAGSPGNIAYDGSYFYVCVAVNTWRRTPIDDWA